MMHLIFCKCKNPTQLCGMDEGLEASERKRWAKMIFMEQDKTIKEIALIVNSSEGEVLGWAEGDEWYKLKRSMLISKKTQLGHLYDQLEKISIKLNNEAEANPKDVDTMIKYTTAIRNLEVDVPVSNIIEVADLFVNWLKDRDHQLARTVTIHFDVFIKQRIAA